MVSRVSVVVSESLRRRSPPQQAHCVGAGTRMRSRGRCSGNGLRAGRFLTKAATVEVLAAARSAASSSSVAVPRRPRTRRDRHSARAARDHRQRQRDWVHLEHHPGVGGRHRRRLALHSARQTPAERL